MSLVLLLVTAFFRSNVLSVFYVIVVLGFYVVTGMFVASFCLFLALTSHVCSLFQIATGWAATGGSWCSSPH